MIVLNSVRRNSCEGQACSTRLFDLRMAVLVLSLRFGSFERSVEEQLLGGVGL